MPNRPLLIFPRPATANKDALPPGYPSFHRPDKQHQINRLDDRINELDRVLRNETAYLGANPANLVSEMILVLEIAGSLKDFYRAISSTPGMEFLGEQQSEFEPDEDFYRETRDGERIEGNVGARLFLTMTNARALQELSSYWTQYQKEKDQQEFPHGTTKFRELFSQLKDIRPYSLFDRLYDTGMGDYLQELRDWGANTVKFEIELAFKSQINDNRRAYDEVATLLEQNGGQVIEGSRSMIPEINYHALIAEAPISSFYDLTDNTNVTFLRSQQILFFRPIGQSIQDTGEIASYDFPANEIVENLNDSPVVAVFDGMPLQNHDLVSGRLIVDDPDDFARGYLGACRT